MRTPANYGPPVKKQCQHCGEDYLCPNARAHESMFCSITCNNKSRAKPRIKYTCESCGDEFMARPDHGEARRFCSRKCFLAACIQPEERACENCGSMFTATRSSTVTRGDGRRLYCSAKCGQEHRRHFEERPCAHCGKMFYPGTTAKNNSQKVCSHKCMSEFYTGPNSHAYRRGAYVAKQSDHKMVLARRPGYIGKYTAEHRLVASKCLGRLLERGEVVIHINNQGQDNRPENLFVCASMSEYARRRLGSLPWPKKSNLPTTKKAKNEMPTVQSTD